MKPPITVLSVAYPFARVGPDAVGGAEQIVHALDRRLVRAGHISIVIACDGSQVAGRLATIPPVRGVLDAGARAAVDEHVRHLIRDILARDRVDLVHLHAVDFDQYLPPERVPVLATLHLPPELSPACLVTRPDTWIHGVSDAQHARLTVSPALLPPIENGVAVNELSRRVVRRRFAVAVGRICPEKGFHLAMDAARRAGVPLLVAGLVFPFEDHQRYFEQAVLSRTSRDCRFVGPLSLRQKRRLLSAARCLLVPSLVEETSSLVAMEALACGTPVIAFPAGALRDIVEHGVTGFIVRDVNEMADAIHLAAGIDPAACRAAARARFSADRMFEHYLERYKRILAWSVRRLDLMRHG